MKKLALEKTTGEAKETREQIGVRLAEARMPRLRKRLKSIGKLGDYPLGEARTEKLCATLDQWLSETKILLRNHQKPAQETFHF